MTRSKQTIRSLVLAAGLLLGAGLAAVPGTSLAQGVDVALLPAETNVGLGVQFDIEVTIPDTSAQFNAFELEVSFDDTLLTLVSNQQGPLVTGGCGNRFHVFDETDGTFTATVGLLCAGAKISGPGVIYTLKFQAASTATITWIRLEGAGFSDAGISVTPVKREHALVRIGNVTAVPGDTPPARMTPLHAYPNPFRGAVNLSFTRESEGPLRLDIYTITGQRVRRLVDGDAEGGNRTVVWDGNDDMGIPVSRGIYLVRLVDGGKVHGRRIVKIR